MALIIGVAGQDSACLIEFLLKKRLCCSWSKTSDIVIQYSDRIDCLYQDPHIHGTNFFMYFRDMTDSTNLVRLVQEVRVEI
jgi:GDPmannose 4,6-dehydratase